MSENVVEAEFKDVKEMSEQSQSKMFTFICGMKGGKSQVISLTGDETETHEDLLEELVCAKGGIIFKGDLFPIVGAKNIFIIRPFKEGL